jgi:wyosine [tRNA(Phe)-imidazoG37] synthetase (radical SAM superfamily)
MGTASSSEEIEPLSRAKPIDGIVYGPVTSRRLRVSLGINPLGLEKKLCNFDCPYCDLGPTLIKVSQIRKLNSFPTTTQITEAFQNKIIQLTKDKVTLDFITFSGNGEPTLHPDFLEIVKEVKIIRNLLIPEVKMAVLSNGSTLNDSQIIRALDLLDERFIKLDAGNDRVLEQINSPLIRANIDRLVQGAKTLKDVVIQTIFVSGSINNTMPEHIDDWIESIGLIKPKFVHIYSVSKQTAKTGIAAVPRQRLKEISILLEKRTKTPSLIFS